MLEFLRLVYLEKNLCPLLTDDETKSNDLSTYLRYQKNVDVGIRQNDYTSAMYISLTVGISTEGEIL